MRTLIDIPTLADDMTLAGGLTIRARHEAPHYVVHAYSTMPDGSRGHIHGGYHNDLSAALLDLQQRCRKAEGWTSGGALDFWQIVGVDPWEGVEVDAP